MRSSSPTSWNESRASSWPALRFWILATIRLRRKWTTTWRKMPSTISPSIRWWTPLTIRDCIRRPTHIISTTRISWTRQRSFDIIQLPRLVFTVIAGTHQRPKLRQSRLGTRQVEAILAISAIQAFQCHRPRPPITTTTTITQAAFETWSLITTRTTVTWRPEAARLIASTRQVHPSQHMLTIIII